MRLEFMKFIGDESYLRDDGTLYLHFEDSSQDEIEWAVLMSNYLNRYATRQLSGRSLKVAYKYPILKAHYGEFMEGSCILPQYNVYSDVAILQINAWLKREAIYLLEEQYND